MSVDPTRIAAGRETVLKILSGEVTPENEAALFDEDVVHFQLMTLEAHDFAWLKTTLTDPKHDLARRDLILANMSQSGANRVLAR